MHVGMLIYGSLDTISGGYIYDRRLVDYLRQQGDQVSIISLAWRNYPRHLGDNFSWRLYQQLAQIPVDILIQDELNHPSLFLINEAQKPRRKYPVVSIVHHLRSSEQFPEWQRGIYSWIERLYLTSLDGFIFNSRSTLESVRKLGVDPDLRDTIVAYPGGDRLNSRPQPADLSRKVLEDGPLRLIFVGNLIPRKGFHNLVEALATIPKEKWQLTAIGRTDISSQYYSSVQSKIRKYGLQERIEITGPLDDLTLVKAYLKSHVLAVPSSYEGFGIVYMEAMGYGLPLIAGAAGGAGEIISEGIEGFLVPPDDNAKMVKTISDLIEDRSLVERMGINALRRFQHHPTWEQSMQKIREYLVQKVEKHGRAR